VSILSLQRRGLMKGTAEQFKYIVSFRQSCVDLQIRSAMMHGRGTAGSQEN